MDLLEGLGEMSPVLSSSDSSTTASLSSWTLVASDNIAITASLAAAVLPVCTLLCVYSLLTSQITSHFFYPTGKSRVRALLVGEFLVPLPHLHWIRPQRMCFMDLVHIQSPLPTT